MKLITTKVLLLIIVCLSLSVAEGSGDLSVSGITITNDLAITGLDCTANANGGALTADALGLVTCSDDDATGAPVTDTILVECSGAGLVSCTCPGSHPFLMGGACEKGACAFGGFGPSTSITGSPPTTYRCQSIGAVCPVEVDIICSS